MFNNATEVVLMRQGTRTVLAMQNHYQGPPSDFAMGAPIPRGAARGRGQDPTREVFAKIDTMGAPDCSTSTSAGAA
jgi:hypothetical protein